MSESYVSLHLFDKCLCLESGNTRSYDRWRFNEIVACKGSSYGVVIAAYELLHHVIMCRDAQNRFFILVRFLKKLGFE